MDDAADLGTGRPLPRPPLRRHASLIRRLMSDPRPVLDELRHDHGPMVGLGAGPMRLAIVGDPKAVQQLFSLGTEPFRWGHRYNVLGFVVGSTSLIVSDGDDWKRRRSAVRAGFSRRRLNGWIDMIVEQTDRRVDAILGGIDTPPEQVDLYQEGRELVQEIVVRALFGTQLAARSSEIAGLFQSAQDYLESPFYRQLAHPLPIGRRHRTRADLGTLRGIVKERIELLRTEPDHDSFDMLATLVDDGVLSDQEICDQVITLMGAGLDTTSASLAWMLWCTTLADPGLWQGLRTEADEVLAGDRPFDATHLTRLELADRVVHETTRLHPAGSFSPRMVHEDVELGGYIIPRGTLILWSAHLAGRDPTAWDRPLDFNPDRFLGMTPEQAHGQAAWAPFGGGARNCIGFALAQMELTLILARFAQRLDVEAVTHRAPRAVGMVVNRPEGGAPMLVGRRRDDSLGPAGSTR